MRLAVAAPGSAAGKYPDGNTGRVTTPMPIPDDLAALPREAGVAPTSRTYANSAPAPSPASSKRPRSRRTRARSISAALSVPQLLTHELG
ncbi:DUF3703 domain-containing protein [Streptomyces sp. NPDC004129]